MVPVRQMMFACATIHILEQIVRTLLPVMIYLLLTVMSVPEMVSALLMENASVMLNTGVITVIDLLNVEDYLLPIHLCVVVHRSVIKILGVYLSMIGSPPVIVINFLQN